jgi:transcriptional antiterminator RfaH
MLETGRTVSGLEQGHVHIGLAADGPGWYVAQCAPLKEGQAATALRDRLALEVYAPKLVKRRAGESREVYFFPGYLFVRADLGEVSLSRINSTPGVVHLLDLGGLPHCLLAGIVDDIRARVDALNDGKLALHRFEPGEAVRLEDGAFKGLEAIFVGHSTVRQRVKVLLEFLGQPRELDVDEGWLERSPNANLAMQKQKRRTRGKGRRINSA